MLEFSKIAPFSQYALRAVDMILLTIVHLLGLHHWPVFFAAFLLYFAVNYEFPISMHCTSEQRSLFMIAHI